MILILVELLKVKSWVTLIKVSLFIYLFLFLQWISSWNPCFETNYIVDGGEIQVKSLLYLLISDTFLFWSISFSKVLPLTWLFITLFVNSFYHESDI